MLSGNETVIQRLEEIRSLGVSLAMDDFGSGHSVMSSLESFPFDKIKLDRSYVKGMSEGRKTAGAVIRAVVAMAEDLNVESVAEGIETPEQLAMLKTMGVSLGQGFLLARPMPQADFLARFRLLETLSIEGVETDAFVSALKDEAAA